MMRAAPARKVHALFPSSCGGTDEVCAVDFVNALLPEDEDPFSNAALGLDSMIGKTVVSNKDENPRMDPDIGSSD